MILRFKTELLFLVVLIIIASLLRVVYLDRIPTGIGQDEIDYQLTAKSMVISGKDISGTKDPLSLLRFQYPPTDSPKAELPYFFAMFPQILTQSSLFSARVMFALISVATVVLVYLLSRHFFKREIASIAGILYAINPWEVFIGRTSYEVVPATFFFLLLLYILLTAKRWMILWSIPIIFLAFYSYIATKVIILPFVLVIVIYLYFIEKRKENKLPYVLTVLMALSLTGFFLFSVYSQAGSRVSDILTPFNQSISDEVNEVRKNTITTSTTILFENKFAVYLRTLLVKSIETLSPQYLLLYGDSFYSLWKHGLFYLLDGAFFFIGIVQLLKKERKKSLLIVLLLLFSIIPHLLHKGMGNFTPHITLLFPFAIMVISYGVYYGYLALPQIYKKIYIMMLILGYGVSLLYFSHVYFFYYPIKSQGFDISGRVLSRYTALAVQQGKSVVILSAYPEDIYKKYLFYTSGIQKNTLPEIKQAFKQTNYSLGKVSIKKCHQEIKADIIIYDTFCKESNGARQGIAIADLSDSGERYRIFNDAVCTKSSLPPFVSNVSLHSLQIEAISAETLCTTYLISRPQ